MINIVDIVAVYSAERLEAHAVKALYVGYSWRLATFILAFLITNLEKKVGIITSGVNFIFWLLIVITETIPLYSKIIQKEYEVDSLQFTLFCLSYSFSFIELILFAFAEKYSVFSRGYIELRSNEDISSNPCPFESSSFLSRILFNWITKLVYTGYKRPLDEFDLWDLPQNLRHFRNLPKFKRVWEREINCGKKKATESRCTEQTHLLADEAQSMYTEIRPTKEEKNKLPSLLMAMLKTYWPELLFAQFLKLIYDLLQFVNPVILSALITYIELKDEPQWKGYILILGLFLTSLVQSLFYHQHFYWSVSLGMNLKSSLINTVYQKALIINAESRSKSTVGEIVNLMSIDCERIQNCTTYLYVMWSAPLQIILCTYLLWQEVGAATLSGLAVMVLLIPINIFTTAKTRKYQVNQMHFKDSRLRLVNEVLGGMKILKLYAWEGSMEKKVLNIRDKELSVLSKAAYLNAFSAFCWQCAPFIVTVVTFATYVLLKDDHYIDAETAFVSLSLFNILKLPINMLPMAIPFIIQAHVAVTRLTKYLSEDELTNYVNTNFSSDTIAVRIKNGEFSWGKKSAPILRNINVDFPLNKLIAIVGQVGAGKSSLVSAILGEMEKIRGSVDIQGSVAYVPQEAWIQNKTLKDNILFGKAYDKQHYEAVLEACALKPDLEILPGGDQTEIGEKGINLSGGQKQRISLARAVYANKEVYIFDDPLSAVDAHVGKHIFDKVFGEMGMLKNKTRILVTHGVHWLPKVDKIVVLLNGIVSEVGSYEELISHDGAFAQFLLTYLNEEDENGDPEIEEVKTRMLKRAVSLVSSGSEEDIEEITYRRRSSKATSLKSSSSLISRKTLDGQAKFKLSKLIQEEKMEQGKVKLDIFLEYMRSLGIICSCIIIMLMMLNQGSSMFASIWLSEWTDDPFLKNHSNVQDAEYTSKNYLYLGIYGVMGVVQAILVLSYSVMYAYSTIRAARSLHKQILETIIRCPMSFFDITPIGRILNRFSRDIDVVDNTLGFVTRRVLQIAFQTIGTIIIVGYSTPDFLIVIIPILIVYYFIQRFYIPTSRQLKRLESTTRSPIYTHFSETVSGCSVIRAYKECPEFIYTSRALVERNQIFYFANNTSNRWLGFRLELLGNFIVVAAALFAVLKIQTITGGLVGLSVSYALQVTSSLNLLVRMTSDFETNVVSVERLKEYTEITREAPWHIPDKNPPQSWPSEGKIDFINYKTRYRNGLDLVLKGITCYIKACEKIGIVGRTGAGKSSLTLSLFRIIEAADGSILIDGHNIADMGLHDVRGNLTILPQDPLIFSGTLRLNLDPFDKHTDEEIWKALELAHLRLFISNLPNRLDFECGEGGLNFSAGQRQLICLARSLLRKSKVLILDEATAAVDMETDELIQKTIREEFTDCTILTIAHRLNTVIDYDRIMVLDNGIIKEFDSPQNLLSNKQSIFHGMAKDAGLVS